MTKEECINLWGQCLDIFRDNVSQHTYNIWFSKIVPLDYTDGVLQVQVSSYFFIEHLETQYLDLIRKTLQKVYGPKTKLTYTVVMDQEANSQMSVPSTQDAIVEDTVRANHSTSTVPEEGHLDSRLIPKYNFSTFIEGQSNKLVRSVGEAISQQPGKTFNPFFIYGPSGVGKTHLANAIGIRAKELHPKMRVLYISAHEFQRQYTDSVLKNTTNNFIGFYQTIDILIIDDIQELAGATKTQNTFFHIFNQLHMNGKQLIMTSDRSPILLQGMEDRLITRFKWGMVGELENPGLELRRAILLDRIHSDGLTIPSEVSDFIAENITGIRDMEGILVALMASSTIEGREIDLELAESIVSKHTNFERKSITIDLILETVCGHFGITQDQIHDKSRKHEIVQARQIAMYLAKMNTDSSTAKIGKMIGGRDHATVLHAIKTVTGQAQVDRHFKGVLDDIIEKLRKA